MIADGRREGQTERQRIVEVAQQESEKIIARTKQELEATAEKVKQKIGSAYPGNEVLELEVKGRNLAEGVPRSFTLTSNEVLEALQEPLQGIVGRSGDMRPEDDIWQARQGRSAGQRHPGPARGRWRPVWPAAV